MRAFERRTKIEIPAVNTAPHLKERPDRRNLRHRDALVQRLRGEFREIPGLCLTPVEASRLFGMAPDACKRALIALVEDGLLDLRTDGRYAHRPSSV
jgi:hypothetical protein